MNIAPKVIPNEVVSRLLKLSKAEMNKKRLKTVKNQVRKIKRKLSPGPVRSKDFTQELDEVFKTMKNGNAADYYGRYAAFLEYLGPTAAFDTMRIQGLI